MSVLSHLDVRAALWTGRLGDVPLGSPRAAYRAAFGPPHAWFLDLSHEASPVWGYEGLEVHFDDDAGGRSFLLWEDGFDGPYPKVSRTCASFWGILQRRSPELDAVVAWFRERGLPAEVSDPGVDPIPEGRNARVARTQWEHGYARRARVVWTPAPGELWFVPEGDRWVLDCVAATVPGR